MPIRNTRIDTRAVDRLARQGGEWVLATPASPCPCARDRNRADANCLLCGGYGLFWDDATDTEGRARQHLVRATVADVQLTRQLIAAGQIEKGDLVLGLALAPWTTLTVGDRVEFRVPEGEPFEGEDVIVTGGQALLSYRPALIESVLMGNPLVGPASVTRTAPYYLTAHQTTADLPTGTTAYYQEGQRAIVWTSGAPADGTIVAVRYRAHLEWVCYRTPHPRFQRGTNLSELVALQLKHKLLARMRSLVAGADPIKPVDRQAAKRLAW